MGGLEEHARILGAPGVILDTEPATTSRRLGRSYRSLGYLECGGVYLAAGDDRIAGVTSSTPSGRG